MLKRKDRFTSGRAKASITNKTVLTENEIASINLVKRKVTSLYLNFLTRQGKTGEKKRGKKRKKQAYTGNVTQNTATKNKVTRTNKLTRTIRNLTEYIYIYI